MKIAILRERAADEPRVAATPETVGKLVALGAEVSVEKGAGAASRFLEAAYKDAGATVAARWGLSAQLTVKPARTRTPASRTRWRPMVPVVIPEYSASNWV